MAKVLCRTLPTSDWNAVRLKKILSQFKDRSVLVIGDVGVDRYVVGTVERISPEAPVPIVLVQEELYKLGLAANVADNVRALGGTPLLLGVIGGDRAGDDFKSILKKSGISAAHLVQDASRRTVVKERIVSERQQLLRVDYESSQCTAQSVLDFMMKKYTRLVAEADAIVLEDYAKGSMNDAFIAQVFSVARKNRKGVAVDPNIRTSWQSYVGARILTPNKKEAEALAEMSIHDEPSLCAAGQVILKRTQADAVVVTRGKDGMALFERDVQRPCLIPTYAREVYDVSGAGDTVISVLSLALSCGATLQEAAILGNLAAGIEVGKRGTATVSPAEIIECMQTLV